MDHRIIAVRFALTLLMAVQSSLINNWGTMAAFPSTTNQLVNDLQTCPSAAQNDIDCLNSARSGLVSAQKFIQNVHDVRSKLGTLRSVLSTTKTVLSAVKFVPGVGASVTAFQATLDSASMTVNQAYGKVAAIDDRLWSYNAGLQTLVSNVDRATSALGTVKQKCSEGSVFVSQARDCISAAPADGIRDSLAGAIESFSGTVDPPVSLSNQAMSTLSTACNTIRSFARLPWPNVGFINDALNSVFSALSPIIDALQTLKDALSQRVCLPIPSPQDIADAAKAAANKAAELARQAAERAKQVVNKLNPSKWGRHRRGALLASLEDFELSREEALSIVKRAWCVSVQDVIDGANSALNVFLEPVNRLLQEITSRLPSFSIPGLPDFSSLFGFNLNFNIPSFDLGIDFGRFDIFPRLSFQCAINVESSCSSMPPVALTSNVCDISPWSGK